MSEKPSEYLKRTCLICGCHTNQTINIYEPRSGPNIVQLIQAKFKFQPLNEDKYLCFSCNNWLINWHSLQALNSNDAESPSGTFRSHMNSMVPEKGAGSQQHARRPVAQVRPLQQLETTIPATNKNDVKNIITSNIPTKRKGHFYMKRNFRTTNRYQSSYRHRLKSLQCCCVCGRGIVLRTAQATLKKITLKKSITAKCRKCRAVCKYMRNTRNATRATKVKLNQNLVKLNSNEIKKLLVVGLEVESKAQNQSQITRDYLQKPRVDGKIVAMLRRLGTTLSRETTDPTTAAASSMMLPPIMSPVKTKSQWTRQLDDDEILLDFNTAISEVLPRIAEIAEQEVRPVNARKQQVKRKLTYQMTNDDSDNRVIIDLSEDNVDDDDESEIEEKWEIETDVEAEVTEAAQIREACITNQHWQPLAASIYNILPKGLSVSII